MEEIIMNPQNKISQSQKLMVFVLSMSLYGLATLFTELIPSFQVGIVEFSVEYFLFIPLTLAMLFDPLSAGLGAATGELVFSEIMLGQFGGLGELEKFLTVTIGVYVAGRLVKNPKNRAAVAGASIFGVFLQLFMGTVVTRYLRVLQWKTLRLSQDFRKVYLQQKASPVLMTCCSQASFSVCSRQCSLYRSSTARSSRCLA